jgi:hypothetical protein
MLRNAHFGTKGGFRPFAASASQPCRNIRSRHSGDPQTGHHSAPPHGRCEPKAEVLRHSRSHMQRRNQLKPSSASQLEKRTFLVGAAISEGTMTELQDKPALKFLIDCPVKTVRCAAQVSLDAEASSPNLGPTDSSQLINVATAGRGFHGGVTIKYRDMLVTEMGAIFSVPVSI